MRKIESEGMMRPLIADRSCQQTSRQRFVSTWPQIWSQSVEISINCSNPSAPLFAFCPHHPIFILSFAIFILLIATIITRVFDLEPCDFGFNAENNVLNNEINNEINNEYESEKSGLTNNDSYVVDVLSSTLNDTIRAAVTVAPGFDLYPTGGGPGQTNENEHDFNAVSTATAIVTIIPNQNKSEPHGPHSRTHTQTQQHTVAPAIDNNDKISPTRVGLRGFDIIGCIFNGIIDDNESEYDISSGMCILCFVLFCFVLFCFFLM